MSEGPLGPGTDVADPRGGEREDPSSVRVHRFDAFIFDLDGVITDTASVHAAAWKQVFEQLLRARAQRAGEALRPFSDDDYLRHVDGKPRLDGARSFLASRGIELPPGSPADPPGLDTVVAVGKLKDAEYLRRLADGDGPEAFSGSVALIARLREWGISTAIISASRNCAAVLRATGTEGLFDARVDGIDQEELGFAGKPDPAVFCEAARRLGCEPARTAVVEDALAGVEAGRRGGFALVVGVDRRGRADELRAAGADLVMADLSELRLVG